MEEICPVVNTERLLLATDGSEYSEGAVREAIRLAKRCGSDLLVLAAVEANVEYAPLEPQYIKKGALQAEENVAAVAARAKAEGVTVETVVRECEHIYACITGEAETDQSTMIIMGRRGRKGLKRLVMGSTTSRVIGHAPCSVMVVPRAAQVAFRSIVVATDGSAHSAATASVAIGIAKRNDARLTVIAAVPSDLLMPTDIDFASISREKLADAEIRIAESHAKVVKDAAEKEGVVARAFITTGRPANVIIDAAKDARADLIVVGRHGRSGLERLLMGSVAERVIILSSCAVLVVKGNAAASPA